MSLSRKIIGCIPTPVRQAIRSHFRVTRERKESNRWLRRNCADVKGHVLSIGSEYDKDGEGGFYRDYFPAASSYTTSEVSSHFGTDLVVDVRAMPDIGTGSYDAVYCSGVLEHVDDFHSAIREITRILKADGLLLLGLPFRQAIHMRPHDYWRFTEFGIRRLLEGNYTIHEIQGINRVRWRDFPASYWIKGQKNPGPKN
jgi:SAM-dependent methyltransferase